MSSKIVCLGQRALFCVVIGCALDGCGSDPCKKACDRIADCLQIPNDQIESSQWSCPLSSSCNALDSCLADCYDNASCDAIKGTDKAGAQTLAQCQAKCKSTPLVDGGTITDGPVGVLDGSTSVDGQQKHDSYFVPDGGNIDCTKDPCPVHTYCDLASKKCKPGCLDKSQCAKNEECDTAKRTCICDWGYHRCNGACVPVDSVDACGTQCEVCPTDPHGQRVCQAGACGFNCDSGYLACGNKCISCSDPHGNAQCQNGSCKISCHSGYHLCGQSCFADDDVTKCGTSCVTCPTPTDAKMQAICEAGQCSVACKAGYSLCKGSCQSTGGCSWTSTSIPNTANKGSNLSLVMGADGAKDVVHLGWYFVYYTAFVVGQTPPTSPLFASSCATTLSPYSVLLAPTIPRAKVLCVSKYSYGSNNSFYVHSWDQNQAKWLSDKASSNPDLEMPRSAHLQSNRVFWSTHKSIYNSQGNFKLRMAEKSGGVWKTSTLVNKTQNEKPFWVLSGPGQTAVVAYVDVTSGSPQKLRVATRSGNSWSFADKPGAPLFGVFRANSSGKIEVVYHDYTTDELKYATEANNWSHEVIASKFTQHYSALAYGFEISSGLRLVAFYDGTNVRLAARTSGKWQSETIAAVSGPTVAVRLAIRPSGGPIVATMGKNGAQIHY